MSLTSSPLVDSYFVIVGAQRCGTTYLYRLLDEHPSVEMARPMRPEPKFFLHQDAITRGVDTYHSAYFGHRPEASVHGEKGTSYIESEEAARRMAAVLPDPRIVLLVRDPIQRAISNYRFSVENGLESLPLRQALTEEAESRTYDRRRISASPFAYLRRGRYMDYLANYLHHIPRERTFVAVFEELVTDESVFESVCTFLGIEQLLPIVMGERVNASRAPEQRLPEQQIAHLRAYFARSTAALETFLGREIHAWG